MRSINLKDDNVFSDIEKSLKAFKRSLKICDRKILIWLFLKGDRKMLELVIFTT